MRDTIEPRTQYDNWREKHAKAVQYQKERAKTQARQLQCKRPVLRSNPPLAHRRLLRGL